MPNPTVNIVTLVVVTRVPLRPAGLERAADYGKRRIRSSSSERLAGGDCRVDRRLIRTTTPNVTRAVAPRMNRGSMSRVSHAAFTDRSCSSAPRQYTPDVGLSLYTISRNVGWRRQYLSRQDLFLGGWRTVLREGRTSSGRRAPLSDGCRRDNPCLVPRIQPDDATVSASVTAGGR